MTPSKSPPPTTLQVPRLSRQGVVLGDQTVPLLCGSLDYFRMPPSAWHAALKQLRMLGLYFVTTHIPWNLHEVTVGQYDFGQHDSRLDLPRFLRLLQETGLFCIVRPGPFVNAELTCLGVPERSIWDRSCQALSPSDEAVASLGPPLAFPIPSCERAAFLQHVFAWFEQVGAVLAELSWPRGPVVFAQVDCAATPSSFESLYEQGYGAESVAKYRAFLRQKYAEGSVLDRGHADFRRDLEQELPPKRLDAKSAADLAPHLDFAEFRESLYYDLQNGLAGALKRTGLRSLVPTVRISPASSAWAANSRREAHKLPAMDLQQGAGRAQFHGLVQRITELRSCAETWNVPAFAGELAVGFPAFFPARSEREDRFNALAALAYGLSGFNLHVAVERDRWIGSLISNRGDAYERAEFYRKLVSSITKTNLFALERRAQVAILVPPLLHRLKRVFHAFGPFTTEMLRLRGHSPQLDCLENTLEGVSDQVVRTEAFAERLCLALDARGIDYSYAPTDLIDEAVSRYAWTVVLCPGALEQPTLEKVVQYGQERRPISIGPLWPTRTATFQALEKSVPAPDDAESLPPAYAPSEAGLLESVVDRFAKQARALARCDPASVKSSMFCDSDGRDRVLFLINPERQPLVAELRHLAAVSVTDLLNDQRFQLTDGASAVPLEEKSVRMLELEPAS